MTLAQQAAVDRDARTVRVIIEASKGSRNKFKYVPEDDVFALDRVLLMGSAFPLDFGFVPSTLAQDGDPLDIMVVTDERIAVGCLINTRLPGIVEATQQERGHKPVRNDRLIALSLQTQLFHDWRSLRDAGSDFVRSIEQFFISYNALVGRTFRPISRGNASHAHKRLTEAIRRAKARP